MKNTTGFLAVALVALLSTACGHASFTAGAQSPSGPNSGTGYRVDGMSYNPEAMVATLSNAHVQETYADTYKSAVQQGLAYPYAGGMGGDFRQYYCPGGVCLQPPAPPPPPIAAPASPGPSTSSDPAVTRSELDAAKAAAAAADKKASAAVQVLKNLRDSGKLK